MKIISVDPGYERVGIAIIEKETSSSKEVLLYSDCFQTSNKDSFETRLKQIGEEIQKIIEKYNPEVLSIESLFFNSNQKTALKVSEAKGIIKYIALANNLEILEFTPLQIKIAITGYGRSDKNQVTSMLTHLINIEKKVKYDDEYDAIAIGLTYFAVHQV
ncbi:MAG: crossover junction endodeoxyribonuclease RuvC [Candidatus Pacebacteria bacterium]|nr:crossover junction endodeoxyribonuclease RuvC [Candidatus Paceibacterota bacterium]